MLNISEEENDNLEQQNISFTRSKSGRAAILNKTVFNAILELFHRSPVLDILCKKYMQKIRYFTYLRGVPGFYRLLYQILPFLK